MFLVGLLELCLDGLDALGELVQDLEGGLRRQQPSGFKALSDLSWVQLLNWRDGSCHRLGP